MDSRRIGNTGIEIPPVIVGGNVFGWGVDETTSFTLLDAAVERGLHCIDTADIYAYWAPGNRGGESEAIIGKWLKQRGRRDEVVVHTKGGAPGAPGEFANANLTGAYLTKAVDASLKRLQTDYIDLYYVHYDDKLTPPEETLGAFQRLITQGKIRAIGLSNYAPGRLRQTLDAQNRGELPHYACLQTLYNLYDRADFEAEREAICVGGGLGVMPYFSLASGFLTGKYRSTADLGKSQTRSHAVTPYLNPRGLRILDALDAVAARHTATAAQTALAWLLARPSVTAPISSVTNLAQLDDLVAATQLQLNAADLAQLNAASAAD
ncbi:aldo/keto reductase [Rhodoferax sp.]|uniref:aldo/keto reductase n=1 Tax=Rhodoferax sp. TaxID=50421 RepID=UPI00374DCAD2